MPSDALHSEILDTLSARKEWDNKQAVAYEMRHDGIRRRMKPFPGAADLHFQLIDGCIEKLKPFYVSQLYATETFASFICRREQRADLTTAAGQALDYELKQRSNFETEMQTNIDGMLMAGFGVLKLYWDTRKNCVAFDALAPGMAIVPMGTVELQEADWFVEVEQMTVSKYKRQTQYTRQDADFIRTISGDGSDSQDGVNAELEQNKMLREGITYSAKKDVIIIWHRYVRNDQGKWIIRRYSPLRPDEELQPAQFVPYNRGCFKDGKHLPFAYYPTELKDKGFYSPRGIPELLAPDETYLCKVLNCQADWLSFTTHPTFGTDKDMPNTKNITIAPGAVLPFGIKPLVFPSPPIDLDKQIDQVRTRAEARVSIPDFGIGTSRRGNSQDVTATEVQAIGQTTAQTNDIRARLFRLSLGDTVRMAWGIFIQYNQQEAYRYVSDNKEEPLPPDALHDDYYITPNGSADSWNRQGQLQKALMRKQVFAGAPWINQPELDKSILEIDDPRLVKRVFQDPQMAFADETSKQAMEIPALLEGSPMPVKPSDNDEAHVINILGFIDKKHRTGEPVDPNARANVQAHLDAHVNSAMQKNPQVGRKLAMIVQQAEAQGQQTPAGDLAHFVGNGPQNVVPMQPQGQPGPQEGAAGPNAELEKIKALSGLSSAMANVTKAGVPLTRDDYSTVLAGLGLPPLPIVPAVADAAAAVEPQPQEPIAA